MFFQAQRVYAEELPDSLSPTSDRSTSSRSEKASKTPSEASNSSEDEDTIEGREMVTQRVQQGK